MEKLTEIERIRLSKKDVDNLNKLKQFGRKKSKFIRDAIREKMLIELPQLVIEKKESCPF